MRAYEIDIDVPVDHRLTLPAEVPVGPAKLIVLSPPSSEAGPSRMAAFLNRQATHPLPATPASQHLRQVERHVEEMRADWD